VATAGLKLNALPGGPDVGRRAARALVTGDMLLHVEQRVTAGVGARSSRCTDARMLAAILELLNRSYKEPLNNRRGI